MYKRQAVITALDQQQISALEKDGGYTLTVDGEPIDIVREDVDIIAEDIPGWSVANKDLSLIHI